MKNLFTLLHVFALGTISFSQSITIYDIQYTASISGESPQMGNVVTTYGIVTGVFTIGDVGSFFIQDGDGPWNGIYVNDDAHPVSLGDSVEVTGTVAEYYGHTEINTVTNVTIVNSGNAQPAPVAVSTAYASQEQYEGVLVQVTNATCTNANAGFGQFIVNDGSGNCLIDDQIFHYTPTLTNVYSITGVRFYLLGESKICPRSAEDIDVLAAVGITENTTSTLYPNPATEWVKMDVQPNALVQIYNVTGAMIYEAVGSGSLNVSDFEPGIYQVTILQNETLSTQKLIVN